MRSIVHARPSGYSGSTSGSTREVAAAAGAAVVATAAGAAVVAAVAGAAAAAGAAGAATAVAAATAAAAAAARLATWATEENPYKIYIIFPIQQITTNLYRVCQSGDLLF